MAGVNSRHWRLGLALSLALGSASAVHAGEGQHSARHVQTPLPEAAGDFGPVSSPYSSLANVAPGLLTWMNASPVFGLPGTVVGGLSERTQLTGDWGGRRTDMVANGFFLDVYTSSAYQSVSGGLSSEDAFIQNVQISANLDTGRAGLWSNGIIHLTAQALLGSDADKTNTAGSFITPYTGVVFPGLGLNNDIELTEYFLVQALSKNFLMIVGQVGGPYSPDRTLFGDQWFNFFANYNLSQNTLYPEFYTETPRTAYGIWSVAPWLSLAFGIFDPNSRPDEFFKDFFNDIDIFGQATFSYEVSDLPGAVTVGFTWGNKPKEDFSSSTPAEPVFKEDSYFWAANVSQFLYVIDNKETVAKKLRSGQAIRGVGVFGRLGYAKENTNPISVNASVALMGYGVFDEREYDSFGVGVFYNGISDDYAKYQKINEGRDLDDEVGMEVFYNFALLPSVSISPSYQHIWHPFESQLGGGKDHADVFLLRSTIKW
jgi:carbohydrate-selective porin OprB